VSMGVWKYESVGVWKCGRIDMGVWEYERGRTDVEMYKWIGDIRSTSRLAWVLIQFTIAVLLDNVVLKFTTFNYGNNTTSSIT